MNFPDPFQILWLSLTPRKCEPRIKYFGLFSIPLVKFKIVKLCHRDKTSVWNTSTNYNSKLLKTISILRLHNSPTSESSLQDSLTFPARGFSGFPGALHRVDGVPSASTTPVHHSSPPLQFPTVVSHFHRRIASHSCQSSRLIAASRSERAIVAEPISLSAERRSLTGFCRQTDRRIAAAVALQRRWRHTRIILVWSYYLKFIQNVFRLIQSLSLLIVQTWAYWIWYTHWYVRAWNKISTTWCKLMHSFGHLTQMLQSNVRNEVVRCILNAIRKK